MHTWKGYCNQQLVDVCLCYQLIVSSNFNTLEGGGSNLSEVIFFLNMQCDSNPSEASFFQFFFLFVCYF